MIFLLKLKAVIKIKPTAAGAKPDAQSGFSSVKSSLTPKPAKVNMIKPGKDQTINANTAPLFLILPNFFNFCF